MTSSYPPHDPNAPRGESDPQGYGPPQGYGGQPGYGEPGAPQPYGAQGGYGPPAPVPAPEQGTNGMSIAGFILAFLAAPIGLILSIVGLVQARKRRQKGRGLAIAGIIISVLAMGTVTAIVAATVATVDNISTIGDPGCTKGKEAILDSEDLPTDNPEAMKTQVRQMIDKINAAADDAKNESVRDAMKAVANDYDRLMKGVDAGSVPPDVLDKLEADLNKVDELCTLGGSQGD